MRQKSNFRKSYWLIVGNICLMLIVGWVLTAFGSGSVGKDEQTFLPFVYLKSNEPFVEVIPNCGSPPQATFNVIGSNWPTNETIFLYWYAPAVGDTFLQTIAAPHSGSFAVNWTRSVTNNTEYLVKAASDSYPFPDDALEAAFTVPCSETTPAP